MAQRAMRMPVAGPPVAAAVALGAALVIGGCQAEGTPPTASPTPSPSVSSASSSASGSPSPSPTKSSAVPATARVKSEKGAEAFARFYVEQSGRAWTAPDASLLDGLATENCDTCRTLASTAEDLERDGHRYSSAPIKVVSLTVFRGGDEEWVFDSVLREQKVQVLDDDNVVINSYPAREIQPAIAVVWRGGQWWVDGIGD